MSSVSLFFSLFFLKGDIVLYLDDIILFGGVIFLYLTALLINNLFSTT